MKIRWKGGEWEIVKCDTHNQWMLEKSGVRVYHPLDVSRTADDLIEYLFSRELNIRKCQENQRGGD